MADQPATVHAPAGPVYRIGRSPDPFAAPDWVYAQPDGTFGGRFDDPSGRRGVPANQRFRVLYFATEPVDAFAEVLAHFRPDLTVLAALGSSSAAHPAVVPAAWRVVRRLGATILTTQGSFVDIGDARTLKLLRAVLVPTALALGLPDLDLSMFSGPARMLTQEAARFVYEQRDSGGIPRYAGIRYTSRLHRTWECWAVFADRLRLAAPRVEFIAANDPGLLDAASVLGLKVT
ncbi:MAG: RES domain-containing protein [Chloroflexota bacterium]